MSENPDQTVLEQGNLSISDDSKTAVPPSPAQRRALEYLLAGRSVTTGLPRSAFGPLGATLKALKRRGWLAKDWVVTQAGVDALK